VLWILQNNIHNEPGFLRLVDALAKRQLPFMIVKPVPFTHQLLRAEMDTSTATRDVEELAALEIDATQPVIAFGSYTLAQIAAARGWRPGAFLENLSYDIWSRAWPSDWLLNPDARITCLRDADFEDEIAFVRPVKDSKLFAGKVFERAEFLAWKTAVLKSAADGDPLDATTQVTISSPRMINTETRVFVVAGEVVTFSQYRRDGKLAYSGVRVDDEVLIFAAQCIAMWRPNEAFALDIAQTPDGCRIVEVNCINAAGFYAADTARLVDALESVSPKR
jgi:hypothetical protein